MCYKKISGISYCASYLFLFKVTAGTILDARYQRTKSLHLREWCCHKNPIHHPYLPLQAVQPPKCVSTGQTGGVSV